MKDWKTTLLGVAAAVTALATAKHWIDNDTALCIGAVLAALFGAASQDAKKV